MIYVSNISKTERILKQVCNTLGGIVNDTGMKGLRIPVPILSIFTRKLVKI